MNQTSLLSHTETKELNELLSAEGMPKNCMVFSSLDGFLAAIALNPRFIAPSEVLRWVWDVDKGEDHPAFSSLDDFNRTLELIMRHYDRELRAIDNDNFEPLLYSWEQEDGSNLPDVKKWCEGFMLGATAFIEPWRNVFEDHPELLAPIMLLGTSPSKDGMWESRGNGQTQQDVRKSISDAVSLLYEYFKEQREENVQISLGNSNLVRSSARISPLSLPDKKSLLAEMMPVHAVPVRGSKSVAAYCRNSRCNNRGFGA